MTKPVMIAVGSCWVKDNIVTSEVQLSGISATHYYLNPEINEYFQQIEEYREKFANQPLLHPAHIQYSDPEAEKNADKYLLAEILQFNPAAYKGRSFKFEGTICTIVANNNWFYYGCPSCTRAMSGNPPYLQCPDHDTEGDCLFRYSFKATVMDESASAIVTFFSDSADTLVGIDCKTMVTTMGHDDKREIPPEIKQLEGTYHILEISIGTDKYGEPSYVFKRHFPATPPIKGVTETPQPTPTALCPPLSEKEHKEDNNQLQEPIPTTLADESQQATIHQETTPRSPCKIQDELGNQNQTPIPPTPAKEQEQKPALMDAKRSLEPELEKEASKKKKE